MVVDPAEAPRFWELIGDVARAVGTGPPELVALDLEPNASVGNVGVRGRTVLSVGTPLWVSLEGQQRVGLLAHELGHLAHGDPSASVAGGVGYTGLLDRMRHCERLRQALALAVARRDGVDRAKRDRFSGRRKPRSRRVPTPTAG